MDRQSWTLLIYLFLKTISGYAQASDVTNGSNNSNQNSNGSDLYWSVWSAWSACSRTCGRGVTSRSRECSNPANNEHSQCRGDAKQYKICTILDCRVPTPGYRARECSKHDVRIFRGRRYTWIPYINPRNLCELTCQARRHGFYASFADSVEDGTPCEAENVDKVSKICVNNRCQTVGCDGIVGSGARKDQCGICNGDNTDCRLVSGIFTRHHMKVGYNLITRIPRGACNINITELGPSRNYLALKTLDGRYLLNGHWRLSRAGKHHGLGTTFLYNRHRTRLCPGQCIIANGPLNDTVELQLLFYHRNPGIKYRFTAPIESTDKLMQHVLDKKDKGPHNKLPKLHYRKPPEYRGASDQINEGRQAFSGSIRHRHGHYAQRTGGQGSNRYRHNTRRYDQTLRNRQRSRQNYPNRRKDSDNTIRNIPEVDRNNKWYSVFNRRNKYNSNYKYKPRQTHTPRSSQGQSSQASRNNDNRPVTSNTQQSQRLKHGQAPQYVPPYSGTQQFGHRPGSNARIRTQQTTARDNSDRGTNHLANLQNRVYNSRSDVNTGGTGRRLVVKNRPTETNIPISQRRPYVHDGLVPGAQRNIAGSVLDSSVTYTWRIAGFTECTKTCGGGTQDTRVVCMKGKSEVIVTDENCNSSSRPDSATVICNNKACPAGWQADQWSSCSKSCDEGHQSRLVECRQTISPTLTLKVSADRCQGLVRPATMQKCNLQPCFRWRAGHWTNCTVTCGHGEQTREVMCSNTRGATVRDQDCTPPKPDVNRVCDMGSCAKAWFYTRWSKQCSDTCGSGYRSRSVYCSADDGSSLPEDKCPGDKPKLKKSCRNNHPCGGQWFAGSWTECSATCGAAVRTRDVVCIKKLTSDLFAIVDEKNCQASLRPNNTGPCPERPVCPAQWYMTDWSECSVSCGAGGYKSREVKCLTSDISRAPSLACKKSRRPLTRHSCNVQSCDTPQQDEDPGCDEREEFCKLVKQARMCKYPYYRSLCCLTCRTRGHKDNT